MPKYHESRKERVRFEDHTNRVKKTTAASFREGKKEFTDDEGFQTMVAEPESITENDQYTITRDGNP